LIIFFFNHEDTISAITSEKGTINLNKDNKIVNRATPAISSPREKNAEKIGGIKKYIISKLKNLEICSFSLKALAVDLEINSTSPFSLTGCGLRVISDSPVTIK
jgi:hypothetical protein